MALRYEDRARAEVIKFFEDPDWLFNLTKTDLGLETAVAVIAECIEKRVALGETEAAAISVVIDMLEGYLEGACDEYEGHLGFGKWMAETSLPAFRLPNGRQIINPNAVDLNLPMKPRANS
jgi:hypothetical protein